MGVVSSLGSQAQQHNTPSEAGYHRCWYPVCLARDLKPGEVLGRDMLGTRLVAWRDAVGKPVVHGAYCPHLGADLSVGRIVDGRLRCAYHHWSFDGGGACVHIPTGDKIPGAARLFTYPAAEAWGLIWAFNGESPDVGVPRIPGATEDTITVEAHEREPRPFDTWVAVSNGVDFQHLRTLHGLPQVSLPDALLVEPGAIEFKSTVQHGRISGTNTFAQHLCIAGQDMFMLFCGAPIKPGWSRGHFVVGAPKGEEERLPQIREMMDRLSDEDLPVLSTIRFRRGLLTAADRHLARYLQYVEQFPGFLPPDR
jgi:nitrite reductase/ring-hydroxylating ferredoxin subunit